MHWEFCSSKSLTGGGGGGGGGVIWVEGKDMWLIDIFSTTRGATDKRTIVENYDLVALAIDELIDDGIILETDPVLIASRVSRAPAPDAPNMKNIDLSEQGLMNAWEFGKRRLAEGLRQM